MIVNSFILYQEFLTLNFKNVKELLYTLSGKLEFRKSLAILLMKVGSSVVPNRIVSLILLNCNAETVLLKQNKKPLSYKTSVCCKPCGVSLCLTKDRTCFYEMAFTIEGAPINCCVVAKNPW